MTTVLTRMTVKAPAKPRRRWRRVLWLAAGGVLVGALAYALWPEPIPVDVAAATKGDLVVAVEELARTRVRDRYTVSSPVTGSLRRIELRAGDRVTAGTPVARITPLDSPLLDPRTKAETASRVSAASAGLRQARAAVDRSQTVAQHAHDELDKTSQLFKGGSVAEDAVTRATLDARVRDEELDSSRFGVQTAEHELAMARAALARFSGVGNEVFEVPAPTTGVVLRVLAPSAGPVQPGTALVEVGDPAALEIVTEVLSTDAVKIAPAARVNVVRWGGPELDAVVQRVEPAGFTRLSALGVEEQRVPIVIDFTAPRERWAALGDGYRVETRILVDERRAVLHVPLGAVFRHAGQWAVFVVADGRARLAEVKVGARNETDVEIASGVEERASVVVHPSERVKDGVTVRAR